MAKSITIEAQLFWKGMIGMQIRSVCIDDAAALVAIYAPYVEETAITFETEVPTVAEFRARIERITARYPYLVAEEDGEILGYAYASTFIGRAAADWTVETSVYIQRTACHKGVGGALYQALEEALRALGIVNLCAAIATPVGENPYLDDNSVQFHAHIGYRQVARFDRVGRKFDRWIDLVWMQKRIGEDAHPLPWQ